MVSKTYAKSISINENLTLLNKKRVSLIISINLDGIKDIFVKVKAICEDMIKFRGMSEIFTLTFVYGNGTYVKPMNL